MNDQDLDELLDTWKAPQVRGSWRENVRLLISRKQKTPARRLFHNWRLMLAGTAIAAVVLVVANTSASSRKLNPPPYTVESEIVMYSGIPTPSGCGFCSIYPTSFFPKRVLMTSFNVEGSESVLSWSAPAEFARGAYWSARLAIAMGIDKLARSIPLAPELEPAGYYAVVYTAVAQTLTLGSRDDLVNSGCKPSERRAEVVGHEVILNYPTVVASFSSRGSRKSVWMAPDLSCFALRARVETEEPDGSWTVVSEKNALSVTLNQ